MCATEALEGAPSTLGYPSPEVTLPNHPEQPVSPLGRHKDDVHAMGVMGLQFLNAEGNMPFGPTKGQWERLQCGASALLAVKFSVIVNHRAWVSHVELLCMICLVCRRTLEASRQLLLHVAVVSHGRARRSVT